MSYFIWDLSTCFSRKQETFTGFYSRHRSKKSKKGWNAARAAAIVSLVYNPCITRLGLHKQIPGQRQPLTSWKEPEGKSKGLRGGHDLHIAANLQRCNSSVENTTKEWVWFSATCAKTIWDWSAWNAPHPTILFMNKRRENRITQNHDKQKILRNLTSSLRAYWLFIWHVYCPTFWHLLNFDFCTDSYVLTWSLIVRGNIRSGKITNALSISAIYYNTFHYILAWGLVLSMCLQTTFRAQHPMSRTAIYGQGPVRDILSAELLPEVNVWWSVNVTKSMT